MAFQSSDMDMIVASKWMYDRISKSPFFKHTKVHLVPFGLDLTQFKPVDDNSALKR